MRNHGKANASLIVTNSETPLLNVTSPLQPAYANPSRSLASMTNGIGETVLYFLAAEYDITDIAWLQAQGAHIKS